MEQVARIVDGSMERSAFLSACDRSYLTDRSGFVRNLDEEIEQVSYKIERLKGRLAQEKEDRSLAEKFSYSETWRAQQENVILTSLTFCFRSTLLSLTT